MNPKALYNITYGLYLLSAREGNKDNACIINTVCQVANSPDRIMISSIQKNLTHDMIVRTGIFNLSVLTTDAPFSLFQHFGMQSGRDADKFRDFSDIERTENGLYRLTKYTAAYISARVVERVDLGSHSMFIAELTDAENIEKAPLCTYGYYQSDIKPRPKAAVKKGWVCTVCGYVHEEDEIADDFICPLCKHGKESFRRMEEKAEEKPVKKWRCTICGEIVEGETPPDQCPLCKQPKDKFVEV